MSDKKVPYGHAAVSKENRKTLKLNNLEGAFAVSSDNLFGPYLGLFALALGATPTQIGLLSALPALLGNLLQIPYGILTEKLGKRKLLIIIGSFWNRISLIMMAFVPFFVAEDMRVNALILLATLRVTVGSLSVPAWTAIQAEIIPRQIRGKYYANRNVILNICGLVATFVAGRILAADFPINYKSLFVLAGITGLASTATFVKLDFKPVKPTEKSDQRMKFSEKVKAFSGMLKSAKDYSSYCVSSFIWNIAATINGPFISIYFVEVLGGQPQNFAIVNGAATVAGILCQKYWGRLVDRYGQKNIMLYSGVGVIFVPFLWFASTISPLALLVNFWSGFMWGGYNLAAFNLLLDITPDANRSLYIGAYNTIIGVATTIGPVIGGFVAESFGLRMVFLLSFFLRGVGLWLFKRNVNDLSEKKMSFKDLSPFPKKGNVGIGLE